MCLCVCVCVEGVTSLFCRCIIDNLLSFHFLTPPSSPPPLTLPPPPFHPGMVDEIQKAMARLEETLPDEVDQTYADYQTATFDHCKAVVKHTQEMVLKSGSAPDELAGTSRELTTTYSQLVESARGALATIESTEVGCLTSPQCVAYQRYGQLVSISCREPEAHCIEFLCL